MAVTRPGRKMPGGLSGSPESIVPAVQEILKRCDRCCDELLDVEYRTVCRRLLARAARGDPEIFRRRGRADTAAAAICWYVCQLNDTFRTGGLTAKALGSHFGVNPSSDRASTFAVAAGVQQHRYVSSWERHAGTPELLVSGRRRAIIADRDRLLALVRGSEP